jgi:3-isopropylmalate/(R)-2-methylmalate dehydratase small subunit
MSTPDRNATAAARIFLAGDDIDTDQLAPGQYMKGGIGELAAHCLEGVLPGFAASVRPGDILVAGKNFGMGSSREQAAEALKHLGLAAVIARSFAGIFYRNAINLGLPVLTAGYLGPVTDGARAVLDMEADALRLENGPVVQLNPLPENLKALLADGGLVPHLKKRFANQRGKEQG